MAGMAIDHTSTECTLFDFHNGDWADTLDEVSTSTSERWGTIGVVAHAFFGKNDELTINQFDTSVKCADTGADGSFLYPGVRMAFVLSEELLLRGQLAVAQDVHDLGCGHWDVGTRTINSGNTLFEEKIIVLNRNNAAADDQDVTGSLLAELFD